MSRQFLMICDDAGMQNLKEVFKENTVQFLEIQGMNVNGENKFNILVTPVNPPVPQAQFEFATPSTDSVMDEVKS